MLKRRSQRVGKASMSLKNLALDGASVNLEDAVSLMELLLLGATLLVSMSLSLWTAYSAADWEERDALILARCFNMTTDDLRSKLTTIASAGTSDGLASTSEINYNDELPNMLTHLPSYIYASFMGHSNAMLCIAVLLGLFVNVSFALSSTREDERCFARWWRYMKFPIFLGYLLTIASMILIFVAQLYVVPVSFPDYTTGQSGWSCTNARDVTPHSAYAATMFAYFMCPVMSVALASVPAAHLFTSIHTTKTIPDTIVRQEHDEVCAEVGAATTEVEAF